METTQVQDNEIVPTLIAQHDELRAEMRDMLERAVDASVNAERLHDDMEALKKTIEVHIALEDGIFYPKLLQRMEEKHMDVAKTKEFIGQMKEIGAQVSEFLHEYDSVDAIRANEEKYRAALETVSPVLMMRISTEEDSVYLYWDM